MRKTGNCHDIARNFQELNMEHRTGLWFSRLGFLLVFFFFFSFFSFTFSGTQHQFAQVCGHFLLLHIIIVAKSRCCSPCSTLHHPPSGRFFPILLDRRRTRYIAALFWGWRCLSGLVSQFHDIFILISTLGFTVSCFGIIPLLSIELSLFLGRAQRLECFSTSMCSVDTGLIMSSTFLERKERLENTIQT